VEAHVGFLIAPKAHEMERGDAEQTDRRGYERNQGLDERGAALTAFTPVREWLGASRYAYWFQH
jgi:hypothetical protein